MKRGTSYSGLALGVIGAALDFYASYAIASNPMPSGGGMMLPAQSTSGAVWGVGLAALGVLLLVTALAGVTSFGEGRMGLFGALMVLYGVVMLLIGADMGTGTSPTMGSAPQTGLGMLVVGALMIVNGSLMLRSGGRPMAMAGADVPARPAA